jgi:hypothetical protein
MSTSWTLPTAIEVAIFVLCLAIARVALRVRVRSAAAALLLMCPVPLVYLVAGANSAIFPSDCMGVLCLFWLAWSHRRSRSVLADTIARLPVVLASLLLVVLPGVSTALGVLSTGRGDWKLIAVGIFRGCSYLGLFCAAIHFGSRGERLSKLLAVQCIAFALICCCGMLQAGTGLDLTLPSPSTNAMQGDFAASSGGGFMGLYRGAIGGWGAPILGAIPLVLFRRAYGWVITPACTLSVLIGIVLAGSRQGLLVGLIAAVLGTIMALVSAQRERARAGRAFLAVAVLVSGGLYVLGTSVNTPYARWANDRFGSLFDVASMGDQVKDRDDRMGYAIERWLGNSVAVQVLGAGRGRISDGYTADEGEVGYVDSELVWQLQENGLVAILAYVLFLGVLAQRFGFPNRIPPETQAAVRVAGIGLLSGICLIYGHFFLLHVQYSQVPVACWNWALFGAALGAMIRVKHVRPLALSVFRSTPTALASDPTWKVQLAQH